MIPKKGKTNHVDKLRTICLMEADFNSKNKKMGRDILKCAEDNNNIPKEQYGSRKNHQAIDQAVNKCLLYDII